jgi:peptidoglycan biosynthesis protein MviN/MurJ (putative lipid II flippase)
MILPGVATAILRGRAQPQLELLSYVAAILLHALLGILLIPRLGLTGALEAMVASALLYCACFFAVLPSRRFAFLPGGTWKVSMETLWIMLPAFALAALSWRLPLIGMDLPRWEALLLGAGLLAASAAIGFGLLLAIRYFRREDLARIFPGQPRREIQS